MSQVELTFQCPNFDCTERIDLYPALAKNNGFFVIICPRCDALLEITCGSGTGGSWPFIYDSHDFHVQTLHPQAVAKIPDSVVKIYREAIRCYGVESYYACAAMCRRAVEAITVAKNASGKTLRQKIDDLGHRALISERSVYHDHYVRSLGNIACHFDELAENQIGGDEASSSLITLWYVMQDVFLDLPEGEPRRHQRLFN